MLRKPPSIYTPEKPLVERLAEALDRAVQNSAPIPQQLVREAKIASMQAPISQPIDQASAKLQDRVQDNEPSTLGHLHYGGTGPSAAQPLYRHNAKPEAGKIFRTQKRMELIVRLENAGVSESQMAQMLCVSVPRVRQIKRSREYLKARIKITQGLIVDHDLMLEQTRDQRREILRNLLPPALQVIANAVMNPPSGIFEKRMQVQVAQDILDREGTFAKISRAEIKPVERFDWESEEASAAEVIKLMQSGVGAPGTTIRAAKLIEISQAFSSGSNIDPGEAAKMVDSLGAMPEPREPDPPEGWAPATRPSRKVAQGEARQFVEGTLGKPRIAEGSR